MLGTNADKVQNIDLPDTRNTIATYPIGVLLDSKNAALPVAISGLAHRPAALADISK